MNKLLNQSIILLVFILATNISFAQIKTEDGMAKAIFETIKTNDSEALSYYCISGKRMTKAINGVNDTSAMAKSVVNELKEADYQSMKYAVINSFDKFITEVQKEKLILTDATFEGIIMNKIKFDISNLTAKKIKFKVSFGTINYSVIIYLFKTKTDMFIYDFSFVKEEK